MARKKVRVNKESNIRYTNEEFYSKLGIPESTFKERFQEFIDYYKLNRPDFKKDYDDNDIYEFNWDCMWSELAGLLISTLDKNPFHDNRENLSNKSTHDILEYWKLLIDRIEELPEHIKRWVKNSDSYITAVSSLDHIPMIKEKIYELFLVIFLCSTVDGGDIYKNLLEQLDSLILGYCKYYNLKRAKHKEDMEAQKNYIVFDMQKSNLDFLLAEVLKHLMKNESSLSFDCSLNADSGGSKNEQRRKFYSLVNKNISIPLNYEKTGMDRLKKYSKYKSYMEKNKELSERFKAATYERKVEMLEFDRKNSIEQYKKKIKEYQREIRRLNNLKYSEENMALENVDMYSEFIAEINKLKTNSEHFTIKNYTDLLLGQVLLAFMKKDRIEEGFNK